MKTAILLINGITLPYHVLDSGMERYRTEGSNIKALFIYQNKDKPFKFSNDVILTKPDFSERTGRLNLETLIQSNVKYTQSYYDRNNIPLETLVIRNPTLQLVINEMESVQCILLDYETFTHPEDFAFVNFAFSNISGHFDAKIKQCDSPRAKKIKK